MNPLAILAAQAFAVESLILVLFRFRSTFGLAPLYVCLGAFQVLQMLAATVLVELGPGIVGSTGSTVLFTASLCAVLLVYVREDALEARKLIYALVLSNVTVGWLLFSIGYQLRIGSARSLLAVPAAAFIQPAGSLIFGTTLLFADSVLIVVLYELFARRVRGFFLKALATMTIVLAVDSVLFVSITFAAHPDYRSILLSTVVGKSVLGACFAGVMALYLWRFERAAVPAVKTWGVRSLFAILTYRERFEILSRLAVRDGLTGVFNRAYFDESLEREVAACKRLAWKTSLLLLDLDHFKQLNDLQGHIAGDRALKEVAELLRTRTRSTDIVSRYGGEEFAIILPDTDLRAAVMVAESIRAKVEQLSLPGVNSGVLTCTIGVASCPADADTAVTLLETADRRLYAGKHAGRNRVV